MPTDLDWEWIVQAVNEQEGSTFKDPCKMVKVLYKRFGGQSGSANYLGIAKSTMSKKLND